MAYSVANYDDDDNDEDDAANNVLFRKQLRAAKRIAAKVAANVVTATRKGVENANDYVVRDVAPRVGNGIIPRREQRPIETNVVL